MHPEISIFGLKVASYNLMAVIGALAAILLAYPALRRAGLSVWKAVMLPVGMGLMFLTGARLWNVAVNPEAYGEELHWYSLQMSGFSLYGGLVGALIVLLVVSGLCKLDAWELLDGFVLPAGVSFCIARIGCFLTGCCAGKETGSLFGVVFPSAHPKEDSGLFGLLFQNVPVHPTQLYELAGALAGLGFVVLWDRSVKRRDTENEKGLTSEESAKRQERNISGSRFLLYGCLFSLMRLIVLPFRKLTYTEAVTKWIYPVIYLGIAAGCVVVLCVRTKRVRSSTGSEKRMENEICE